MRVSWTTGDGDGDGNGNMGTVKRMKNRDEDGSEVQKMRSG